MSDISTIDNDENLLQPVEDFYETFFFYINLVN